MHQPALSAAILVALSSSAHADRQDDLAWQLQESTSFTKGLVIKKLVTLKLGAKCWDKVLDKKQATFGRMGNYARNIATFAKAVTGDDWQAIENQSANTKEKNRELVTKLVDEFASKVHVTVNVEGDDCAPDSALWTKYLGEATDAIAKYPPKAGKAFITIHVTAKAKGVKTEVGTDGATFTITGARDIEASGWPNEIANPIKRVSTKA